MITFALTSPVPSVRAKLTDNKFIVADDSAFVIALTTSTSNPGDIFTVTKGDGSDVPVGVAISGTNFQGAFPSPFQYEDYLFEAGNGEVGTLQIKVVPKFYTKKISDHMYSVYNYTTTNVSVLIEDVNGTVIYNFLLGSEAKKDISLPADGYYKITYTQGSEIVYAAIFDTATVDKIFTDGFRSFFCDKCGSTPKKQKMYLWTELSALRDAYMMKADQSLLLGKYWNSLGFQEIANDFVDLADIIKQMVKVSKAMMNSKCLDGCDCGC